MKIRFVALLGMLVTHTAIAADDVVRFNRDVRPILSDNCLACHGPDGKNRQAELRLDDRESALADHGNGGAVVPGDPRASQLIQRITADDEELRMPPVDHRPRLSPQQVDILTRWIEQGAAYEGHWSFLPVELPETPPILPHEKAHNPIDHFVLAGLRKVGLRASDEADKRTLARRLYLDLIGLPPTPEQVQAFVDDDDPQAYQKLVDQLLDSPHYGERWGRHWLDQARYADSHGYTIDADRIMWPFRDWVIRAHNIDMPFDQFTIEQLAGDLLPNSTLEQRIATGFHRNTLINQEGGTDPEQFRIEAVMDRLATTGAVWLGLTVGCAQCHSHKYDPISQHEYYQLFAFFNHCADVNNVGPTVDVHEGELFLPAESAALRAELTTASQRVAELVAERPKRREAWENQVREQAVHADRNRQPNWTILKIASAKAEAAQLTTLGDESVLASGGLLREIYVIETPPLPMETKVGSLRLRFLPHESLPHMGPGLAMNGNLVLSAVEVYLGDERLSLVAAMADHSQKDYPVAALIDDDPGTGWAINVEPGSKVVMNAEHTVILTLGNTANCAGKPLRFVLKHELNNEFNVGRVQFSFSEEIVDTLADGPFLEALALSPDARSSDQKKLIDSKFDAGDQILKEARKKMDDLRVQLGLGPTVKTMVLQELPERRETYLFQRGDFLQPDKESGQLEPNVPVVFPPMTAKHDEQQPANRLDFARWLVSKQNPLTARVTVNRIWMRYFGRGLVETENDFGSQGTPPTHPELLDWLAWNFMESGWSMKQLHRSIVMSATYRQSSHGREEAATVDPLNLLLSRQNRIRLDAEIVRDVALSVSGKLNPKIGGPSVFPPQPEGVYAFTQNSKVWRTATGDARYRRGIYTMFYRSAPYPTLSTFDTPDFQAVCTRRQRSNTPLQALTLANDAAMVELADALGKRVVERLSDKSHNSVESGVQMLYAYALGRPPKSEESAIVVQYVERIATRDDASWDEAWVAAARAVMNTDEFITRE